MKKLICVFATSIIPISLHAQNPIPENFLNRMISNGKPWKIQSYDQVQVSGRMNYNPSEMLLVKENELIYSYRNKTKKVVQFTLEKGPVDPIIKTSDGEEYEVRFYNKSPVEGMRIRKVLAVDRSTPYTEKYYMH